MGAGHDDFQDLPPLLFVAVGELLGDVWAGVLPFNVQNAVGNWLQLVGQAILTFNAQQQYFENGPGNLYRCATKNDAVTDAQPTDNGADDEDLSQKVDRLACEVAELKEILLKKP